MKTTENRFESLTNHLIDYLDTRWDLIVLSFTEKSVNVISSFIAIMVSSFFGLIAFVMVCIATAKWLAPYLGSEVAAYFVVAGLCVILLIVVFNMARNYIQDVVVKLVIKSIADDDDDEYEYEDKND